jgi:hypothetical protein
MAQGSQNKKKAERTKKQRKKKGIYMGVLSNACGREHLKHDLFCKHF